MMMKTIIKRAPCNLKNCKFELKCETGTVLVDESYQFDFPFDVM
jgi:hypothetical protein